MSELDQTREALELVQGTDVEQLVRKGELGSAFSFEEILPL